VTTATPALDLRAAGFSTGRTRTWTGVHTALTVTALTLLGLGLRLAIFRGIWLDEAISIHQAQQPFGQMLHELRFADRLPPLHDAVLWLVVHTVGSGQLAVRSPSIVAGVLLVPALYGAGRQLYDRRTGLTAALFGAVAPALIWYSQEARPYAFFLLFATLAVWAQVRVLRRGGMVAWAAYTAATAALLWSHYFGILVVGVQQLAFAAIAWERSRHHRPVKELLIGCVITSLVLVAALLPLVPMMRDQFAGNQATGLGFQAPSRSDATVTATGGSHPSVYSLLANFVWGVWGYHSNAVMTRLAALWPFGMLVTLLVLGRGRSRRTLYLAALALVPPLLLFGVGLVKPDLFELRYFIASVPVLLLLIARAVSSWPRTAIAHAAAAVLVAATMVAGLGDQQLDASNPRLFDFSGALTAVKNEARPGDRVLYNPAYLRDVVSYYAPGVNARPLRGKPPMPTKGHRTIVLGSFLDQPGPARTVGAAIGLLEYRHRPVQTVSDPGIKVWVFGR
jgi:4-amino-4-deoxy-L-arabinose transferase-like glycosyltransferase